ncbi:nuclear transport factor 2 family protein [Novosphingobium sp. BL-52-GroH]|uniref:nuclear transport factor 2 family protein n=1 Tax=Novosphingobium sp. BL-52-GroH TaxID=3349877 RepID=UPI00384AD8B9
MPDHDIAARLAITDQLSRYARAMDRIDADLGRRVWHADGTADYGAMYQGSGPGFVDWVCTTHAQMIAHAHRITNVLVEVDGPCASSEAYVHATLRFVRDGRELVGTVHGRYLDRWSLREGRWAIDHRIYVQDMDELRDAGAPLVGSFGGRRDGDDPSYAVLEPRRGRAPRP